LFRIAQALANSSVIKTEAMLKREVIKSQLLRARAEKLKLKNSVRTTSNFSFFSKQTTATQNCTPNDSIMMMDPEHSKMQVLDL
jgi:hypothetical protein